MSQAGNLLWETTTGTGAGTLTLTQYAQRFRDKFGSNTFWYFIVNRDVAGEWECGIGTVSAGHVLTRSSIIESSNSNNAVNFSAGTKDVTSDVPWAVQLSARVPDGGEVGKVLTKWSPLDYNDVWAYPALGATNIGLSASVASNALTISVLGADGNSPSTTNPVHVGFRSATAGTGSISWSQVVGATTLVISSGSTMGASNATAFRLWIVLFNDGGTLRLGAINCLSSAGLIFPLGESALVSSTAEGGAGAADSAGVFYTGTAVTSKPYVILGWMEWSSGLTTAGTWNAVPTKIHVKGPNDRLPGHVVQKVVTTYADHTSTTTFFPFDDTIPQNTEGVEIMTASITPHSAANVMEIETVVHGGIAVAYNFGAALFRNSDADAIAAEYQTVAGGYMAILYLNHHQLANSTSAITYKTRVGTRDNTTNAFYPNGRTVTAGTGRVFGGVSPCKLIVREVVA